MFDSKVTDYTIMKKTPYKKDVLKLLAEACKKEGIKLFFYYSLLDWHDDNYFPRGRTGTKIPGRSDHGDWNKYIAFMKAQLKELLTNYGEIAGIWFDGHWDQKEWDGKRFGALKVDWHYDDIYKLIHDLQPHCLIGNNHHLAPIEGEDFQMFERDLPGQNTTGWGTDVSDLGELPFETCKTINGSWGFNLKDREHKSSRELIQYLVKASSHNSNLLLNVGPMPNGKIQEKHVKSLEDIGNWLKEYGASIYGTRSGPIQHGDSIRSTQKDKEIYIHLLKGQVGDIDLKGFNGKIRKVSFFGSDERIKYKLKNEILHFEIPENKYDEIDTIVTVTLR
jgi:alpha-L-fucosidase